MEKDVDVGESSEDEMFVMSQHSSPVASASDESEMIRTSDATSVAATKQLDSQPHTIKLGTADAAIEESKQGAADE